MRRYGYGSGASADDVEDLSTYASGETPNPVYGPEYRPDLLNPVYGPEYRPELLSQPLPPWVIPLVVGGGAFVLLGGLGLLFSKRSKRRR